MELPAAADAAGKSAKLLCRGRLREIQLDELAELEMGLRHKGDAGAASIARMDRRLLTFALRIVEVDACHKEKWIARLPAETPPVRGAALEFGQQGAGLQRPVPGVTAGRFDCD